MREALQIDLLVYQELHSGKAFDDIEESSIDVVFFTEILEHYSKHNRAGTIC